MDDRTDIFVSRMCAISPSTQAAHAATPRELPANRMLCTGPGRMGHHGSRASGLQVQQRVCGTPRGAPANRRARSDDDGALLRAAHRQLREAQRRAGGEVEAELNGGRRKCRVGRRCGCAAQRARAAGEQHWQREARARARRFRREGEARPARVVEAGGLAVRYVAGYFL